MHELLRRCGRCLCGTCHKRPSRTCPRRLSPRCSVRIPPHQHYRVPGVPFTLLECPKYLECPLPPWSAQTAVHSCRRRAGAVNGAACATSSTMRHTPAGRGTCTTLRPKVDRGVGAPQYPRRRPCMSLWRSQASHDPSSFCSTVWYLASTLARAEQTWKRRSGVLPARFVAALCLRSTHSADLLTSARVRSGCVCRRSNGTAWR